MKIFRLLLLLIFCPGYVLAQPTALSWGLHLDNHLDSDIDSVTDSGGVVIHIPLLSIPQKGNLPPLKIDLVSNNLSATFYQPVYWVGGDATYLVNLRGDYTGPGVFPLDNITLHDEQQYTEIANDGENSYGYLSQYIADQYGTRHLVQPPSDGSNGLALSVDGSGYTYGWANGGPFISNGRGVRWTTTCNSSGYCSIGYPYITDSNGNQIVATYSGSDPQYWTDSYGNHIDSPWSRNTGCKNLSYNLSPTTSSPYSFCYEYVSATGAVNTGGGPAGHVSGNFLSLTSVSTPAGNYTFSFDSWGSLSKVTLPSGGSLCYQWITTSNDSDTKTIERRIQKRILDPYGTDCDSATISLPTWTYSYTPTTYGRVAAEYRIDNPDGTYETRWGINSGSDHKFYNASGTLEKEVQIQHPSWAAWDGDAVYSPTAITTTTLRNGSQFKTCITYAGDTDPCSSDPIAGDVQKMVYLTHWYGNSQVDAVPAHISGIMRQDEYASANSTSGNLLRRTEYQYKWQQDGNYFDANIFDSPVSKLIIDYSSVSPKGAKTVYQYDETGRGPSGAHGNQTTASTTIDLPGSTTIDTHVNYGTDGMPISSVDGNGKSTTYSYQCSNALPYQVTDPLGHMTQSSYNCASGKLTERKDSNDLAANRDGTKFTYDTLGNLQRTDRPDGSFSSSVFTYGPMPTVALSSSGQNGSTLSSTVYYDGLGRQTQAVTNTPEGQIEVDRKYDLSGRLQSMSNPFNNTGGTASLWTSYLYDVLGRVTDQCQPSSSDTCIPSSATTFIHTDYNRIRHNANGGVVAPASGDAGIVEIKDESGRVVRQTSDALGRLIRVEEPSPAISGSTLSTVYQTPSLDDAGSFITTSYQYNALDGLVGVVQSGTYGQSGSTEVPRTRSFSYDSLGRLVSSLNPEVSGNSTSLSSSCSGSFPRSVTCYEYDSNGNLKKKTNPSGIVITYAYDDINRLTSRTYSGGQSTPTDCYSYEDSSVSESKGRLTSKWTQAPGSGGCSSSVQALSKNKVLAYNIAGHITSESRCIWTNCWIPNKDHTLNYTWDLAGNLWTQTNGFPVGDDAYIKLTYTFDSANRNTKVASSWSDANHPGTLFNVNLFTPSGAVSNADVGTNLSIAQSYDSRLRIFSMTAGAK
ncbi:RHS repeat protein [Terriglobus tenax]|uniref:RHS repeat protein n=1 Tax=Terriglobus tenax TaxID=1111115 RepID=UPI0021E0B4FA|nr:RHS repeat protein [Terriglobus tenax]